MALDTRSKRASSVGLLLAFMLAPVLPDATLSQGDRQHAAQTYSGILAAVLVDPDAVIADAYLEDFLVLPAGDRFASIDAQDRWILVESDRFLEVSR